MGWRLPWFMKYQRVIYPQGTNAFQNSFPIFFHFCPLSLKLPEKIPLVKVLPGNACSNINFSMYSDWTNCSNLFKGGSYLKWFMFPTHNFLFSVDIWSVGCIMGELVKGCVIFQGTDRILPGTFPAMLSINTKGSRSAKGKCCNSRLCFKGALSCLLN